MMIGQRSVSEMLGISFACLSVCLLFLGLLLIQGAFHQEAFEFLFTFCHKGGVICISEVIDISCSNLDSSLCFIQPSIPHDVLCLFNLYMYSVHKLYMYSAYKLSNTQDGTVEHALTFSCENSKITTHC